MTHVFIENWERSIKSQWYPRLQTWGRQSQQVSAAIWSWTRRAYAYLITTKEEELRAWWRVQQDERRIYWTRRGYADAKHGTRGYPHHGSCYCAWCQAYWSGFFRYEHGGQQRMQLEAPNKGNSLGFLSPPPRRDVLTRVAKAIPLLPQADSRQAQSFSYLTRDHSAKHPNKAKNNGIATPPNAASRERSKQRLSETQAQPRRRTQTRYSPYAAPESESPSRTNRKRTQEITTDAVPRQFKAAKSRSLGRSSKASQRSHTIAPN